jgi:general secretion pathway protein D
MISLLVRAILCAAIAFALVSCAAPLQIEVPPARLATSEASSEGASTSAASQQLPDGERAVVRSAGSGMQLLEVPRPRFEIPQVADPSDRFSDKDALSVAVEGMAFKSFLEYVLGQLLKVQYIVPDGLAGLDQGVTFNSQGKISSRRLYRLVTELLASRGLQLVSKEDVFFVGPIDAKQPGGLVIGYGASSSDVPASAGSILQIVPIRYGLPNISLERTLAALVDAQVLVDTKQSALFITGPRASILRSLDLVRLLDQPGVRSSRVAALTLGHLSSREFIEQVTPLLANEGITSAIGASAQEPNVSFVPVDRLGLVVVFATSDATLQRVEFWASQLDRPGRGPDQRFYVYQPRFSRASDLGESLVALMGGPGAVRGNSARDTKSAIGSAGSDQSANSQQSVSGGTVSVAGESITFSVDSRSNSLIFFTNGARFESLQPLLARLDVPPKQVLLEAMIAEVSLSGEFANGVEFAFSDRRVSGGTLGQLGLPSGGLALNYIANVSDQVRLRLRSADSRVNILSSPILVVRDGADASIQVGNQVPTTGSSVSDPIESQRVVTTVQYRDTGVTLNIKPTINAQGLVVMEIQQSIVNSVPGSSGVQGAPIFFQRSVTTEVVAASGQSVLLAGLISESGSDSSDKIPVLGRLPGLGVLFRSDTKKREKTELVLLITPQVLESPSDWNDVRGRLDSALQFLNMDAAGRTRDQ